MNRTKRGLRRSIPWIVGAAGTAVLLLVFMGVLTWGGGSIAHAFDQLAEIWYWVLLLTIGFGTQLGLFTHIKMNVREHVRGATAEVAASGGVSTGSMIACCAHYLTTVLPLLGMSAAAAFLVKYQTSFLLLGVLSNLVGLAYMLYFMQKHDLMPRLRGFGAVSACNMRSVRNATIIASVVIVSLSFFLTAMR